MEDDALNYLISFRLMNWWSNMWNQCMWHAYLFATSTYVTVSCYWKLQMWPLC